MVFMSSDLSLLIQNSNMGKYFDKGVHATNIFQSRVNRKIDRHFFQKKNRNIYFTNAFTTMIFPPDSFIIL